MTENIRKADKDIILDASTELKPNDTLNAKATLEKVGKNWRYSVETDNVVLLKPSLISKSPEELTDTNRMIKKVAKKGGDTSKNTKILINTFKELEAEIAKNVKKALNKQKKEEKAKFKDYIESGRAIFEQFQERKINVPQYIASISRWLIAGEEANVIKILLAVMNTAKGEATNILSESASASGKTHIEKAGFSLVHNHHYVTMNFSTTASFRNHASEDPYMFKNKVVRLGDLGNEANQEVLQEVMGIIKILNSEGMYESFKMDKDNETQLHFILYGKTAMCYSKVANNLNISDQDSSRGIIYSPNPLNDVDFEEFAMWQNTPDYITNYKDYVDGMVHEIQDYMEYLINCDIQIINPYQKQISDILKKNKAYRRILTKELWLLNSLALLNLPNKKIYNINGGKFIYVSVQDVMNYLTLYRPDIIANSNYDMNVHSYRLYEMIAKDYVPIHESEVMTVFGEELERSGDREYDEYKFKQSNRFFTINTILDRYRGTHQLTNIISEVKKPNDKLRKVLQNMIGLIGYTIIPEENFTARGGKPTLYYICEGNNVISLIDKLVMDKKTLQLIAHLGMKELIPDIIEDFKSLSSLDDAVQGEDKIIMKFDDSDCNIMDHHPDIDLPPSQYITEDTIRYIDSLWSKHFPEAKPYHKRKSKGVLA